MDRSPEDKEVDETDEEAINRRLDRLINVLATYLP